MWGCFLMSGVKILHVLKDWWKSIPIHQNYTMALTLWIRNEGFYRKMGYINFFKYEIFAIKAA